MVEDVPKSRDLWHIVKPHVRAVESADGVLVIDDSIEEKPYTDENDIVCRHYDHSKGRQVKGIHFMTALYHSQSVSLPVAFQIVAKTEHSINEETKTKKRRSPISKNTYYLREIFLGGADCPLHLVKLVFVNEDQSTEVLYLVAGDTTLNAERITTLYRTRWHVEENHKSLNQNASLEKSPTRTVATQTTHFFAALCDYIELEMLKRSTARIRSALKLSIHMHALMTAFEELCALRPIHFARNLLFA